MSLVIVKETFDTITLLDGKDVYKVPRNKAPELLDGHLVKGRFQGGYYPCLQINGQLNPNYFRIDNKFYYCSDECIYSEVYPKATTESFKVYLSNDMLFVLGDKSYYHKTQLNSKGYVLLSVEAYSASNDRLIVCIQGTKSVPVGLNWVYNEIFLLNEDGFNLLYATNDSRFAEKSSLFKDVPENDCSLSACKQRVLNAQLQHELLKFDFIKINETTFSLGGLIINLGG